MSAIPLPSQSKPWWSRSKAAKDVSMTRTDSSHSNLAQDVHGGSSKAKEGPSSKFNTFVASAIGKKSKKPTLTIQDPPSPYVPSPSSTSSFSSPSTAATSPVPSQYYTNRPPAKSVSTVRSYETDRRSDPYTVSEPRTPSDHPRDRSSYQNSVLTFSDPDPFAAGGIVVAGMSQDPNRLSVWSDSSLLDPHAKRGESLVMNRMSYGSSSSNSHGNPADAQGSSRSPPAISRQPPDAGNVSKRRRREASLLSDGAFSLNLLAAASATIQATIPKSAPASATTSPIEPSVRPELPQRTIQPANRPSMRARGMTVAGDRPGTASSSTSSSTHPAMPSHPLRLHRQASESHIRSLSKSTGSTASPIMFASARSSSSSNSTAHPQTTTGRPLVLVRKASSSRMNLPPLNAAPPSTRLPAPPLSPFTPSDDGEDADSFILPDPELSSCSSSLSFATVDDIPDGDELSLFGRETFPDVPVQISPPATIRNMNLETPPRPHTAQVAPPVASTSAASHSHLTSPVQSLKKTPSQPNMSNKRVSEVSLASALSLFSDDMSPPLSTSSSSVKAPRKQRSFHHPRIPLPQLPTLRYATSRDVSAESSSSKSGPTAASPASQPRRRLFSGGSSTRRTSLTKSSTTPPSTADDDLRSLFSLSLSIDGGDSASREASSSNARSQPVMMSFANMGNQLSLVTDNACISPSWEEMGMCATSNKRASVVDYVPQHIMSPAAMLRLEEQLSGQSPCKSPEPDVEEVRVSFADSDRRPKLDIEPGDFGLSFIGGGGRSKSVRSRTDSLLSNVSTATMAFGTPEKSIVDERSIRGLVGVAQTFGTTGRRPSTATDTRSVWTSPSISQVAQERPSTARPDLASPPVSPTSQHSASSELGSNGLPPPPRPRASRDKQREVVNKRASVAPMHPLSPPPRRPPSKPVAFQEEEVPGPVLQSSRPPSAFGQKPFSLNRKSLIRKPSFLDIDDEWDQDDESFMDKSVHSYASAGSRPIDIPDMESSFLDLDRGNSFDTVRSFDDNISYPF